MGRTDDLFPSHPREPYSYASNERVDESTIPQDAVQQWADGRYAPYGSSYSKTEADARFLELTGGTLTGALAVILAAAGYTAASSAVSGDSTSRWYRQADGSMAWGDGVHAADVTLSRSSPGVMAIVGSLDVSGQLAAAGDVTGSDLHANRASAPLTGVIYLGNNSGQSYLYYDGGGYYFGQVSGKSNTVTAADFQLA